jgi:hypothetical protein
MSSEPESVESITKYSGHELHLRVASILEIEGWNVAVSPYYIDDLSDKPREIDIVARKRFSYISQSDNEEKGFYLLLGIDCKYITQNAVIWGRENKLEAGAILTNVDGWHSNLTKEGRSWSRYSKYFNVGRLISEGNGSQALQGGILQAVKGTLDAFNSNIAATIFYPAVVYKLKGGVNIFSIGDGKTGVAAPKALEDDWIYHVDYAFVQNGKRLQKNFYVDLVSENKFIDFLHKLNDEGKKVEEHLHYYSKP